MKQIRRKLNKLTRNYKNKKQLKNATSLEAIMAAYQNSKTTEFVLTQVLDTWANKEQLMQLKEHNDRLETLIPRINISKQLIKQKVKAAFYNLAGLASLGIIAQVALGSLAATLVTFIPMLILASVWLTPIVNRLGYKGEGNPEEVSNIVKELCANGSSIRQLRAQHKAMENEAKDLVIRTGALISDVQLSVDEF